MTATGLRDETSLVYRFETGHDGAIWLARQLCEQWLRERHVRTEAIGDLILVATELCTGATDAVLRVRVTEHDVELEVESSGVTFAEGPTGDLRLAAGLCDEIVLRVTPDRTFVLARLHGVVLPE